MAEQSSVDPPASESEQPVDLSSEMEMIVVPETTEIEPGTSRSQQIVDEMETIDPDYLLRIAEKYGGMSFKPTEAKSDEDAGLHQSYMKFGPQFAPFAEDNIKPSFYEFTKTNENGLIEIDIEKLERKVWSLSLAEKKVEKDENSANQTEPEKEENSAKQTESEKEENSAKQTESEKDENFAKQTEPEKDSSTEEQKTEKLTEFKYERKNKLWDRKPHLREMGRDLLNKICETNFTDEALETYNKDLINSVELNLNQAVNILRRIAYPKLCEKHFSSKFPSGAFAEEDKPSISVDHFEFLHEELPINFLEQCKRKDFHSFALSLEKDPKINNKMHSFIKFLESGSKLQFPEKCFTLILAVLKNPYRKIEVFYDDELPVVKEQMTIIEYLMNCLHIPKILDDKDAYEKLAEAIIRFANIHSSFLAHILEGFNVILSEQIDGKLACQIYCKVLNLITSIGATFIDVCLPQHFEKISRLAANDRNHDLYFHLLSACEISIANTIEHGSLVKEDSSGEIDLFIFYTACYSYFGLDLTTRLLPIFKKYEKRKNREEQYLSRKHSIFPSKYGYMNIDVRCARYKIRIESESLNFQIVKECAFNSAGKVLLSSSNAQLGYIIQEDMYELSPEDLGYWTSIDQFPLSYLEGVTD